MTTDSQLQHDVLAELQWDPAVDHTHIGVTVSDGIVTLSGFAISYMEKVAAEKVARRVAGVRGIAEEIKVRFPADRKTGDAEIAKRIAAIFDWNVSIPKSRIRIQVEHGAVTLTGRVDWRYQSEAARKAISGVHGITGVANLIEVHNPVNEQDVRDGIETAFRRLADLDIASVTVRTEGSKVILGGKVKGLHEREVAERAAWSSPGVTSVEDEIRIVS
ncbi:BON domain-containing protein [Sphingomonas oryzagri]